MRSHFGFDKQSNAPKLRTATHQMSAYSHDAAGGAAEDVDNMRSQISKLHARVAAIQTSTYQKCHPESPKKICKTADERTKRTTSTSRGY